MSKGQKSGYNHFVSSYRVKPAKKRFAKCERTQHRIYCREIFYGIELEGIAPSNVRSGIERDIF